MASFQRYSHVDLHNLFWAELDVGDRADCEVVRRVSAVVAQRRVLGPDRVLAGTLAMGHELCQVDGFLILLALLFKHLVSDRHVFKFLLLIYFGYLSLIILFLEDLLNQLLIGLVPDQKPLLLHSLLQDPNELANQALFLVAKEHCGHRLLLEFLYALQLFLALLFSMLLEGSRDLGCLIRDLLVLDLILCVDFQVLVDGAGVHDLRQIIVHQLLLVRAQVRVLEVVVALLSGSDRILHFFLFSRLANDELVSFFEHHLLALLDGIQRCVFDALHAHIVSE